MDLNAFLEDRRERWQRLDRLLDTVEAGGLGQLNGEQVDELFRLYRLVSSDLNLAQTRTANPAMIEYLEALVGRAWSYLVVQRRPRPFRALWHILRHRFPATIRREWKTLLAATAAMCAGAAFGFIATWVEPDTKDVFISAFPEHLTQTPAERVAEEEAAERGEFNPEHSAQQQSLFATFVTVNNIRVTVLAFALGLTFGVGTIVVLFYNGTILGSIACWYWQDGVFTFFCAWIGPHGSIELPCICFGAAAGLMLARCQVRVEGGTTWQQIRHITPRLVDILIGTAVLLAIAGFIEGGFSQIDEPTLAYWFKILVAAMLFAALVVYLFVMPVKPIWKDSEEALQTAPETG